MNITFTTSFPALQRAPGRRGTTADTESRPNRHAADMLVFLSVCRWHHNSFLSQRKSLVNIVLGDLSLFDLHLLPWTNKLFGFHETCCCQEGIQTVFCGVLHPHYCMKPTGLRPTAAKERSGSDVRSCENDNEEKWKGREYRNYSEV